MKRVDLNVDIGEGQPFDEDLLAFATSANVCCGAHAGSEELAERTVARCRELGVRVGAHPGFPDRKSMGRRPPAEEELPEFFASVRRQLRNFKRFEPAYVKPHGALYNWLSKLEEDEAREARSILGLESCRVMALAGTRWCRSLGGDAIPEGFADRRLLPSGTLAPRGTAGAVLGDPEEVAAQALRLAGAVETICLHGDTPGCVECAQAVVRALRDGGWETGP